MNINTEDSKTQEAIQCIHANLLERKEKSGAVKEDYIKENCIFAVLCSNFDAEPREIARAMNTNYGFNMTGNDVIKVFRDRRIANPNERKEIMEWAAKVARAFPAALQGNSVAFENYENLRRTSSLDNGKNHKAQYRIAAIMIYEMYPELTQAYPDDISFLHTFGDAFAKFFFYDISDILCKVHKFVSPYKKKRNQESNPEKPPMTLEQALDEIDRLQGILDRTNALFQEYQDEFEQQLAESKVKELAEFFARLNSEKYGCIIDELLVVRKGVNDLRKRNYQLPMQINGLLMLVGHMIAFVQDSHIVPMMKINSKIQVTASDVEFCNYEGSPFINADETKTVTVVSPGWIYKDKELQISRPKVKEEKK